MKSKSKSIINPCPNSTKVSNVGRKISIQTKSVKKNPPNKSPDPCTKTEQSTSIQCTHQNIRLYNTPSMASQSHSNQSQYSSNHHQSSKSRRQHSSSQNNNSSSLSKQLRPVIFTMAVFFTLAVICSTQNTAALLSFEALKSMYFSKETSTGSRYIRSVSSQDNNPSFLTRVSKGVTEMYKSHFLPLYHGTFSSIVSDTQSKTPSALNLSKGGKLHYIPSSAYDPTKTAHHVLEGAGYRLNIPSYVQSIPLGEKSDDQDSLENNQKVIGQRIKNDNFDLAITQKQVIRPRLFATNPQPLTETGLVKQAVFNPNDVPLSTVDPELDSLVKEMIETQQQADKFSIIRRPNATQIFSKNSEQGTCLPSKNVVFAKTHKTGGTTITNMLLRHAEKQKLNVALPIEYHWELAGYPSQFEEKLITPKQSNYDVMCHHMRFNKTKIEELVNPLADYFTILRDPVTNFESSFGFFKDYPFTDWLDNSRSIDDFIDNADSYYNKSTPWYFRAKNYMSFDLGFNHENNTDEYVRHAISKMESDFKFVMITDRYEESMILLKNMLCLDYDDIVYLPLKVRTDNDRKRISAETAAKIKKWNRLDTAIYEYFSRRFEQMTIDYGKEKLASEVQILREKLKDVEARCVEDYDSQSLKPWIKRIKLRKPSGQKCQRLVWGEVKYADYLRQLQYSQLSEDEYADQPPLDDKISLMQDIQKSILGEMAV